MYVQPGHTCVQPGHTYVQGDTGIWKRLNVAFRMFFSEFLKNYWLKIRDDYVKKHTQVGRHCGANKH